MIVLNRASANPNGADQIAIFVYDWQTAWKSN
jgi:hypothetical protein